MKTTRLWEGYISGTNRGAALIREEQDGNNLKSRALLEEQGFGTSILDFIGTLHDNHGEFHLIRSRSITPFVPLDGEIKIDFHEESCTAIGTWSTDLGNSGSCSLRLVPRWRVKWWTRLAFCHLRIFWHRYAALIYSLALLTLAVLAVFEICKVSYPALILFLIPAPFLFRTQISALIQLYRLRKAGPFEFETQIPPPEVVRQFIGQQIEERLRFLILDGFFVPRTKAILLWLARNQPVTRSQFNTFASSIGVVPDNIQVTWEAILFSECASYSEDRLALSELGWRYINHLSLQGRPSQV